MCSVSLGNALRHPLWCLCCWCESVKWNEWRARTGHFKRKKIHIKRGRMTIKFFKGSVEKSTRFSSYTWHTFLFKKRGTTANRNEFRPCYLFRASSLVKEVTFSESWTFLRAIRHMGQFFFSLTKDFFLLEELHFFHVSC